MIYVVLVVALSLGLHAVHIGEHPDSPARVSLPGTSRGA